LYSTGSVYKKQATERTNTHRKTGSIASRDEGLRLGCVAVGIPTDPESTIVQFSTLEREERMIRRRRGLSRMRKKKGKRQKGDEVKNKKRKKMKRKNKE
jgi:hypothetical protein